MKKERKHAVLITVVVIPPGPAQAAAAILSVHAGGSDNGGTTRALYGEIDRGMPPSSSALPTLGTGSVGSNMPRCGNFMWSSGTRGQRTRGTLSAPSPPLGIRDALECLGACNTTRRKEQM